MEKVMRPEYGAMDEAIWHMEKALSRLLNRSNSKIETMLLEKDLRAQANAILNALDGIEDERVGRET